ncbi:hypothetical protein ATI61_11032 [Archangium gephyra]|uniref:GIY-YIG domain-containing protein n=1 Tax=Archangium gephyra TaxID=48 RepID=A0ABX9JTR8_9BACT|nr:hypothetical protein ATI61_11032 [Archangium gephyra]
MGGTGSEIVTGLVPKKAMPVLKNKLRGYLSHSSRFYVGATANPALRAQQHAEEGWTRMVLLYEAYSPEIARRMEQELIDFALRANFEAVVENIHSGGGGLTSESRSKPRSHKQAGAPRGPVGGER